MSKRLNMKLGLGYQGSKNRIAEDILAILPSADNLYDIFAGGCAITHQALLSGKYKHIYANDICDAPQLFKDAIDGKYKDEKRWISRKTFLSEKDTDPYIKYCWSFSNNGNDYMYSLKLEPYKEALWEAVVNDDWTLMKKRLPEVAERCKLKLDDIKDIKQRRITNQNEIRDWITEQIKTEEGLKFVQNHSFYKTCRGIKSMTWQPTLQSLERLQSLQSLERLQITKGSYTDVNILPNSIIYCDPPYINTHKYDNAEFDYEEFYDWCEKQEVPTFISEYYMPEDRFIKIWEITKKRKCSATKVTVCDEKIYIPKKWEEWWKTTKTHTCKNKNLHAAKKAKNDEFYTQLTDIEKELKYYKDQFKDKVVYCNCDNPQRSEFVRFFRLKFCDWGLKKLIATCITEDNSNGWGYVWDKDINGNGIMDEEEVTMIPLQQNGDFRSPECIEFLKEADIVVTNPPFSLFREYVKQLMDNEKKFLIIGNNNAVTYKEIFPYIKNGKLRLGHASNKTFYFEVPDGYAYEKEENGKKYGKVPAISWFTNLETHKADDPMELVEKFDPVNKHLHYDNYDAYNVDKVSDIPYDTDEILGVPITIVDRIADDGYIHFTHNEEELKFEIVAFRKGEDGQDLVFTRERERIQPYSRVLVRRRLRG